LVFDASTQVPEEWQELVHALGFDRQASVAFPEPMTDLSDQIEMARSGRKDSTSSVNPIPQEAKPKVSLWVPLRYSIPAWGIDEVKNEFESNVPLSPSGPNNPSGTGRPLEIRYLASWSQLRTRLQPLLQRPVLTRLVDEKKLAKLVSLRIPISKVPRKVRKRSPERLHVIADINKRCTMLAEDQRLVIEHLSRELPQEHREFFTARNPSSIDLYYGNSSFKNRNIVDDSASHLLILGDLGILDQHRRNEKQIWKDWIYKQWLNGKTIFALVPFSLDLFPEWLQSIVQPIAWQGNQVRYVDSETEREELITKMFVHAYPAMRIEPQLLRALRLMIPSADDASLESSFWQHSQLADNHFLAAKNDRPSKESRFRKLFYALPEEGRTKIVETIRSYRQASGSLPYWYLEFLNLDEKTRKLIDEYDDDSCQMLQTVDAYQKRLAGGQLEHGMRDQLAWYAERASEAALDTKNANEDIRYFREELLPNKNRHSSSRIREVKVDGSIREVKIRGTIHGLECEGERSVRGEKSTAIALQSTSRLIEVHVPRGAISPERAFWKSGVKPQWVSDYGTDQFGAWCEFQVPRHDGKGNVTQRMRWIKPGEFMMGSPKGEGGRENESPQHPVTLPQGYWLADSQVTQELWTSIAGKNPSRFRGDTNPVEQISWRECQKWLPNVLEKVPTLQLALPTEAQWEYACRAGSTSAYCFGDDPKELPKYGWFDENSDRKTHPVKQLQPNGWGLYDMHGNVWEWCSDRYGDYAAPAQSDPPGPTKGTTRVIRGGGWYSPARFLRSACRDGDAPGFRGSDLGFRLLSSALGAEPSERAMLPVAEQGTERARPVQVQVKDQETVRTDRFWKSGIKPQWVSDYGKDDYGLWCEFQLPNYWSDTKSKNKDRVGNEPHGFVTQRMRWIKPGVFLMGSDQSTKELWYGDETQHEVTLTQGFWMADTPCTQVLWIGVENGMNPSYFEGSRNPVEQVSWEGCQEWLKGLGDTYPQMRPSLPTEAQWEYACRAGSTGVYCFGDSEEELEKYAWYSKNSAKTTHPVGEKLPNAWGLYDMHGNIWEWCLDWYAKFRKASVTDPVGASGGTARVIRGGSWIYPARDLRSACRLRDDPGNRYRSLGFRLLSSALGAEPSEQAMLPVAEQGTERARIGSAEPAYEFLRSVDLDATGDSTPEEEFSELGVNAYSSIRVVSDQEGYQFDRLEKPSWAVDFGSDRYGLYATFEVKPVSQRMRWIPPGKFVMGSPDGKDYGRDNEGPQHEVIITHGYWMFDTPVTQGLWTALMGDNPSYFPDPERPVEQVSWEDAVGFAKKLNERLAKDYLSNGKGLVDGWERLLFRLPTEAEWEYACRAGTRGDTYAGDLDLLGETKAEILDAIAWYGGNSGHKYDLETSMETTWSKDLQADEKNGGTRKVAQKAPNPWGLFDMLGNVWEWCQDWYGDYPAERVVDPTGPTGGSSRVIRGGCWVDDEEDLHSTHRVPLDSGDLDVILGFRLLSSAHLATESVSRLEG
jgi:formylglycine-generating enzyme required for sulfatase activity